jgi:hypothetical protein
MRRQDMEVVDTEGNVMQYNAIGFSGYDAKLPYFLL